MRSLVVACAVVTACKPAPARDPRDVARIEALEQRVAALEAQVRKVTRDAELAAAPEGAHPTDAVAAAPVAAPPAPPGPPTPPPPPPPGTRWAAPDPAKVYAVPLDDSPILGPAGAPITIVASLQFPEPYTHRVMPTLMQLRGEYRSELRIVVKQYIVHPRATTSSIAACATAYQDGLAPMDVAIWDAAQDPALQATPTSSLRQLDEVELRELARALRFDLKQYDQDFTTCKAALARDQPVFTKLGQNGVPGFWINGRPLSGAQPIESFRKVIDEERAKWKADKARGGKAGTYYERLMKTALPAP